MALPKGFKKNLNILPIKIGADRRQEYLDNIGDKGTYLPEAILEEDLDKAFTDFVKNEVNITIDGIKIPVYFFTQQRWSEFNQTWQSTDGYKNMVIPFITIVRHPDIQEGTNQGMLWNIPGHRNYTYYKVPTFDGIRNGVDVYKVPQPTAVDITYEVRLFVNRMKETNLMNRQVRKLFQSRQHYINVNGHPIPLLLENTGDESNIEDFNSRRYYVIMYEIMMMGYILDDKDFEIIPTLNRNGVNITAEKKTIVTKFEPEINNNFVNYSVIFQPNVPNEFSFVSNYNIIFDNLVIEENATRIVIKVNNSTVFDGLVITNEIPIVVGDTVSIRVYRNVFLTSKFKILGYVQ